MTTAIFASLHHLLLLATFATLVIEAVLLRQPLDANNARRLGLVDGLYGLSALFLLIVGLLRVFKFEKGSAFYLMNGFFWLKMAAVITAGLLSIYPTVQFIRWSQAIKGGNFSGVNAAQGIQPGTISSYLQRIRAKLGVENNSEITEYAFRLGLRD